MEIGEIIFIVIMSLVGLFIAFIIINNVKFAKKQNKEKKDKEDKNKQPVADISPVPIQNQSNKGKEEPLSVNDKIFKEKLGYDKIIDRIGLDELIKEEEKRENKKVSEKFDKIEITNKPIDGVENKEIDELFKKENENSNVIQPELTIDEIKSKNDTINNVIIEKINSDIKSKQKNSNEKVVIKIKEIVHENKKK